MNVFYFGRHINCFYTHSLESDINNEFMVYIFIFVLGSHVEKAFRRYCTKSIQTD